MDRTGEYDFSVPDGRPFRIAVLGDTHLLRGETIPPDAIDAIRGTEPDLILHTGDVVWLPGLAPIRDIARLLLVRGNRDFLQWRELPAMVRIRVGCVRLLLFHGYGNLLGYARMKVISMRRNLAIREMNFNFPPEARDADVLVYGHTHMARAEVSDGKMILNPGALTEKSNVYGAGKPSFALITVARNGLVEAEIRTRVNRWHASCRVTNACHD